MWSYNIKYCYSCFKVKLNLLHLCTLVQGLHVYLSTFVFHYKFLRILVLEKEQDLNRRTTFGNQWFWKITGHLHNLGCHIQQAAAFQGMCSGCSYHLVNG